MSQSRIGMIGDAISQLFNVLLLPDHHDTNANESVSGRAYRCDWKTTQSIIDTIFFWDRGPDGTGHCELAYYRDVRRALDLIQHKDN